MGLFRKNKGTPLKELERYHGKRVSYVVEREGAEENVIGRTGGISVDSEKLVVVCDGHEVFRCSTDGIVCAELMSHNGADIKGRENVLELQHQQQHHQYMLITLVVLKEVLHHKVQVL